MTKYVYRDQIKSTQTVTDIDTATKKALQVGSHSHKVTQRHRDDQSAGQTRSISCRGQPGLREPCPRDVVVTASVDGGTANSRTGFAARRVLLFHFVLYSCLLEHVVLLLPSPLSDERVSYCNIAPWLSTTFSFLRYRHLSVVVAILLDRLSIMRHSLRIYSKKN